MPEPKVSPGSQSSGLAASTPFKQAAKNGHAVCQAAARPAGCFARDGHNGRRRQAPFAAADARLGTRLCASRQRQTGLNAQVCKVACCTVINKQADCATMVRKTQIVNKQYPNAINVSPQPTACNVKA